MAHTYVLYSASLNKYYIGCTETTVGERLEKHLRNHKGFTGTAKDWQVVWSQSFETKTEAYAMERKIKAWKSTKAIVRLIMGE